MFTDDILYDIDLTLDKLIENAKAMKDIELLKEEIEAFQKTQESLLAHLIHMDEKLDKTKKGLKIKNQKQLNLQEKLNKFEKLNKNFIENASAKIRHIKTKKLNKKN